MGSDLSTAYYVLLSKRYFSRYVLTYEILPLYLCHAINDQVLFNEEILNSLLSQKKVTDKDVILKLEHQNPLSHISFSNIVNVGFCSQESLNTFLERSYENYDVNKLHCSVLLPSITANDQSIDITPPVTVDKLEFSNHMAFTDAIMGLIYEQISNNKDANLLDENYAENVEALLDKFLLIKEATPAERDIGASFFRLCTVFNINTGWNSKDVVDAFEQQASKSVKETTEFTRWLLAMRKLLNGENLHVPFTDSGNITLRAMTLVLLNPEVQNIEAIKQTLKDEIGFNVYQLALKFAKARTGYSYLNAGQRKEIEHSRSFLQELNAIIHNRADLLLKTNSVEVELPVPRENQEVNLVPVPPELDILHHTWLKQEADSANGVLIRINGIKPLSGFSLSLVYKLNEKFSLQIIDGNGPKGISRFKGQLALNMLILQKDLPDSLRFEINDTGLYLTLPLAWAELEDLKDRLNALFSVLKPLGIEQKSSRIIVK